MKVLITGAGGQLGRDLIRVLAARHELHALTRGQLDVGDDTAVEAVVNRIRPDVIIHAAAYTNVDGAESEAEAAYRVNSAGTWHMAEAAARSGAKLVYVSTDYVFDGAKGAPYTEGDKPNPISVYGTSKLHGEKFVSMLCERHFIVRTSWLYGRSGSNFVTKIIEKARGASPMQMVGDVFGSPTYSYDLAELIGQLIETEHYGTYHGSNAGVCTRYQFASEIIEFLGIPDVRMEQVTAEAFPLPAARPQHSALADTEIHGIGVTPLRPWKEALHHFLQADWPAAQDAGDRQ
ncbi:dTDP-4-dehydrorhamnose reductase [Paenibacillus lutrae]|uniref:dTDP-4-dehydrorhamnose reductase n=1 Tax=Paenibacillus lutrae TaxID=2078573 RepID=A0A7X3FE06_9BACL|nr:dTDP-4-dehydrorhamnose reductase [Paenibacillus lutrae]MVO97975.1 dTDP-4-dehydrorhamnose reductase [Paenibacillus lutrae]